MCNIVKNILVKSDRPVDVQNKSIYLIDYDSIAKTTINKRERKIWMMDNGEIDGEKLVYYLMAGRYTKESIRRFLTALCYNTFFTKECIVDILRDVYLIIKCEKGENEFFYLPHWGKDIYSSVDERIKYCKKNNPPEIFKLSDYKRNKKEKKEKAVALNVLRAYYTPMGFKSLFIKLQGVSNRYEREEIIEDLKQIEREFGLKYRLDDYICFEKILNLNTATAIYNLVQNDFEDLGEEVWKDIIVPLIKVCLIWPGCFSRTYILGNIDLEIDFEQGRFGIRNPDVSEKAFIRNDDRLKEDYFKECIVMLKSLMKDMTELYESIVSQIVYEVKSSFKEDDEQLNIVKRNIDFYILDGNKTYYTWGEVKEYRENNDEEYKKAFVKAMEAKYTYNKESVLNELYFVNGIESDYPRIKKEYLNYPPPMFYGKIEDSQLYAKIQKEIISLNNNL